MCFIPTSEISIILPEHANGTLYCNMTVQTEINLTTHYASYSFYTTHVSQLTFSEMQSLYYEMLVNYTAFKSDYDSLLANYSSLLANYTALLSAHNQLTADYNSKVAAYSSLLAQYNKLSDDYDSLDANYRTKINDFGALQTDYEELKSRPRKGYIGLSAHTKPTAFRNIRFREITPQPATTSAPM